MIRWSEDGVVYSSWIPYRSVNEVLLSSGDGYKELRVEARDRVGNVSTTYAGIIVNTTAADSYGIVLNNGDSFTSSNTVNVSVSTPRSVFPPIAEMQYSDNGVFDSSAPWQVFALGGTYTFTPSAGPYRLFVRFRSVDGTILQVVSDEINVDSAAPTTTMSIKSVTSRTVQVALKATDRATSARASGSGIAQMQIAAAGNFGTARWVPFSSTVSVAYGAANKNSGIYARFRDKAGNVSATRCITPKGATCSVNPTTVTNLAPTLTVSAPYRVTAGSTTVLSAASLQASDNETPGAQLVFTLVSEPVNGWMLFGGARMTSGTRFTAADLARKRVVYRQNGTTNEHDRIVVQVADAQGASSTGTLWFLLNGVADPELAAATAEPRP